MSNYKQGLVQPCGCASKIDEVWKVRKSINKCESHISSQQDINGLDGSYYEKLGTITKDGKLAPSGHISELMDCLEEMNATLISVPEDTTALEVGCGTSPYVPLLQGLGYSYTAIEPSSWAAKWIADTYKCSVIADTLDGAFSKLADTKFDLVLAAHSLEHMKDAPESLILMHNLLKPGGRLLIVVPDDEDLTNPDHLWFFNQNSLRTLLYLVGFKRVRMTTRRIVAHENFIYCAAYT